MAAYSFIDVHCAIDGPGGAFSLSDGGVADEGITVAMNEDKNTMTTGADGSVMHSLHAARSGTVTVRLLKTSPLNHLLSVMYNTQQTSSALWGQNVISVRNPVRGDDASARICAFKKLPDFANAKDGNIVEWAFDAGAIDEILGDGNGN
ncbi:phage structural protein [Labrys neptuniae]